METYEREVRNLLVQAGCSFHREGKGDHEIWYSPLTDRYITDDGKIKSRHTANAILKQAGVGKKF